MTDSPASSGEAPPPPAARRAGPFGRALAALFAILFVVTAPAALLASTAERTLLRPGAYKQALARRQVYERLPGLLGEASRELLTGAAAGEAEDGPPPDLFAHLTPADLEAALAELLPAGWLREQVEGLLDGTFAFLRGEVEAPELTLSLSAVRDGLQGEVGARLAERLVASWPPCTPEELRALQRGGGDMVLCRPPESFVPTIEADVRAGLAEMGAGLPETLNLGAGLDEGGDVRSEELRMVRQIAEGARLSLLFPAALLGLVALAGARARAGLFRWWGVPLLLAGLLGLAVAAGIRPAAAEALAMPEVAEALAGVPEPVALLALELVQDVLGSFARAAGVTAGGVAAAGVLLLVASRATAPRTDLNTGR